MFTTLLFLLFIFSLLGILFSKSLISPEFISPFSWFLILLFYKFLNHGLYTLSDEVLIVIGIWNFFLLLGVYLSSINKQRLSIKKPFAKEVQFNQQILKLYYNITIYGFFPTLYIIYRQVQSISGDFFYSLRMANTGLVKTDISLGIFAYTITFASIAYSIELIKWQKGKPLKKIIILFVINFIFAFITVSKTAFLFLITQSLIIYLIKNKKIMPNFNVIKYVVITIFLMIAIQNIRDSRSTSESNGSKIFYTYLLGGIPALDKIVNSEMSSVKMGQHTFSLLNNIGEKIGIIEQNSKGKYNNDITDDGYLNVPYLTNVYTVIGPIWLDFKYFGLISFSMIVGYISGFFYYKSLNYNWALIVYAYLFCVLFLQFFGEYIFTNMSLLIQLIVLSYIPYRFKNKKIVW